MLRLDDDLFYGVSVQKETAAEFEELTKTFEARTMKLNRSAHQLYLAGGIKNNKVIEGISSASREASTCYLCSIQFKTNLNFVDDVTRRLRTRYFA